MPTCKACVKAHDKAYRAANVDQIRAYQADYRKANADQYKAYQTEYREANGDRIRAQQAEYYNANVDQIRAHQAANPHIGWEARYRTRCRKFGYVPVIESFTSDDMIEYWGNGERCIYCNGPFREIDHMIPVGLGGHHVITNVAPSCRPCNRQNIWTIRATRATAVLTNA